MTNRLLWIIAKLLIILIHVTGNSKSYTHLAPHMVQDMDNMLEEMRNNGIN